MVGRYSQDRLDDFLTGWKVAAPAIPLEAVPFDGGVRVYGDWLTTNQRFPQGLGHVVNSILQAGGKAGIWIGPSIYSRPTA